MLLPVVFGLVLGYLAVMYWLCGAGIVGHCVLCGCHHGLTASVGLTAMRRAPGLVVFASLLKCGCAACVGYAQLW